MSELYAKTLSDWLPVSDAFAGVSVAGVCQDSRLCVEGDAYLALSGASHHGYQFALSAVENGAVAVLVSPEIARQHEDITDRLNALQVPVVELDGLDDRASALASAFYDDPSRELTVVAVTGTDGKTSVCQFVKEALSCTGSLCGYIGTLGWGVDTCGGSTSLTTPDCVALQRMMAAIWRAGASVVALEASSHGIAEGRLNDIHIDVAVLTNLGRDHLDYHATEAAYAEAKAQLFRCSSLKAIVVNGDDGLGRALIAEHATREKVDVHVFHTGSGAPVGKAVGVKEYFARNLQLSRAGLQFELTDQNDTFEIVTPLYGRFNAENLSACYAVLRACNVAANDSADALVQLGRVAGRMEPFTAFAQPMVVVDYAHTPQALEAAIAAVRDHTRGDVWVVFGCGGDRDTGKRALMARAAESADHIIVTDDNPRTENPAHIRLMIVNGFANPSAALEISDRARAIQFAIWHAQPDDAVLVAGKGHEDYQVVGDRVLEFSDRDTVARMLKEAG